MFDIGKQIAFWRESAVEDLQVAEDLIKRQRTRHGLFFLHLAVEKLLKALVCRQTQDLAPRMHDLIRLAELAGISLDETQVDTLSEINAFNLEGRYPDALTPLPSLFEAKGYLREAEEVFRWLMNQLQDQ
jgi:HEPN domain-containing protein